MDLDAILQRRPALVLVDELAHTNAPGSRHPKRYLDVEELLAAGIDVYSTMNVQHVESLNDVVARITRIRVRETVPDRIIDAADEVELVDLTPADLMERLREGKVYVREQAQRALRHYFSPGNLTALRELALRRTAERVDDQMLSYMREHAIAGPWAAGERVIVCLDPSAAAANAVRAAKRTADGLDAELIALYVETDRHAALSEAEHGHLAETMRLAAELGAEVVTVPGRSVVEEVLAFARSRNATRVVVGKSRRSRWFELRHGSVVDDLVRSGSGLAIEVAPSGDTSKAVTPTDWLLSVPRTPGPYLEGALTTALATGAGMLIDQRIASAQHLAALCRAGAGGGGAPWAGAVALGLRSERASPTISSSCRRSTSSPSPIRPTSSALFLFMLVAVAASALAARTRSQTEAARREARTTAELYAFSRKIAGVIDLYDLLWIVVTYLARLLNAEVVILMPHEATEARPQRGLSARRGAERGRPRRRALVVGCRPPDRPRHRYLARRALAVRADPHQPFGRRRDRRAAEPRRPRAGASEQTPARRRRRPGGRRHRAPDAGRRYRPGAARRRARAAAVGHADLGVARSAHAARLDHRFADQPAELSRSLRRGRRATSFWARR